MNPDVIELDTEKIRKQCKHPTLKEVQRKMKGFPDCLVMYTYHKLNGRDEEAESYLHEFQDEQEEIHNIFKNTTEEIKEIEN